MANHDMVFRFFGEDVTASEAVKKFAGNAVKAIEIAGAAVAGMKLAEAFTEGLSFESARAEMQAAGDLTAEEAQRQGDIAGRLFSGAYSDSLEQGLSAVTAVTTSITGMREASDADLEAMTQKVLTFAKVMEVDVDRAAQVIGQTLTNGLAPDAAAAADLVYNALQQVPKALRGDMLDAIDEYGPHFSALGLQGEEAFSLLVNASDRGMYGLDKTGDALKELTIRATDMSTASQEAYELAGLDAEAMANKVLAGGSTAREGFNEIVDGLLSIENPQERANAAIALFGTPLEDLGTNDIPKFLESLKAVPEAFEDASGSVDRSTEILGSTGQSRIDGMRNSLDTLYMQIVEVPGPLGDMVAVASALGPEFLMGAAGVAFLGSNVISAAKAIPGMVAALKASRAAQLASSAATGIATAVQWAWNAAMTANPIGIIIVAIAALVAGLIWFFTQTELGQEIWANFTKFLGEAWANVSAWFMEVGAGIAEWWTGFWGGLTAWVTEVWTGFTTWLSEAWANITLFFQVAGLVLSTWWNGFWSGLGNFVQGVVGWVIGAWNGFIAFFTGIPGAIGRIASGMWDSIWKAFRTMINWIINGWNSLAFEIPEMEFAGITIGGFRLEVPQIPKLATGGVTMGETLAIVGDNPGGRELIQPLDEYEAQRQRDIDAALAAGQPAQGGGDFNLTLNMQNGPSAREIFRVSAWEARRGGYRPRLA